jgi:hypothetical protein
MVIKEIAEELADVFTTSFLDRVYRRMESSTIKSFFQFKRALFNSVLQLILFTFGFALLLVGIVLFLSRFVDIDLVLLVFGLILVNIVLFVSKFK